MQTTNIPNNRPGIAPEPALSVTDLGFKTGYTSILRNIQFQLFPGEILLLIGPNGAGKSTLLKCLAGLLPYQGKMEIFGHSLKKNYDLRKKLGYLGHESFLYMKFSARENLLFYAALYGIPIDIPAMLNNYQLSEFGEQLVETFSRGMKQKLSLARALLHNPELVFLDEPFTGLDQLASAMLREKILQLKNKTTVVLTTHELEQGFELCDKLLILKGGRQAFFGSKEEISGDIREFYSASIL
ncbi:ABC transporter ATP-binding protein [bacterium]|nr:ABC transporter ATP-binding protein [bacterium]MCI0602386.1 ABC transporter ATP-binding protein [bacterium]